MKTGTSNNYHNLSKKILTDDKDLSKLLVIVPTYNEEKNIEKAIKNLKKIPKINFLIVNDCSTDNTQSIIEKNKWNHIVNSHNLKLAETFRVGVDYALKNGYLYVVQFDGDGQHESYTILEMFRYAKKGYDIVLSSRYLSSKQDIYNAKRFAHKILKLTFRLKTHQTISDPTCGLRLYNWQAMNLFVQNKNLKPEPSSLAYFLVKEKMKIKEVPTTVYVRENGESIFKSKRHILKYMLSQICETLFLPRKVKHA